MTDDEFVDALHGLVDEAWENYRYFGWVVASAALAGARLGRWFRQKGWLR